MSTLCFEFSPQAFLREARIAVTGLLAFGMLVMVAHGCSGCNPPQDVSQKGREYTAAIVKCASTAKTKAEDHACRVRVNHEFGLCDSGMVGAPPGDC